ncbi:GDSL lipase/esterase [Dillenia turbinata]|uniref:GDSL lipase/esterase n=1 Tax=Dillenia turbinata TaxID=194707 RepID=A0AAN8YWQ6_9MAGN
MGFGSLKLKLFVFAIWVLILCSGRVDCSKCRIAPIIFNFGDSNSDTGGLVAGLGYPVNLPNGRAFFNTSTGRLSDGRLIIDFLCELIALSLSLSSRSSIWIWHGTLQCIVDGTKHMLMQNHVLKEKTSLLDLKTIYNQGGRKFWVHNTGPLGCLPQKLSFVRNISLDPHGCLLDYNSAAKLFNSGLLHLCQDLRSQLKDATIVYVDIYSIKYDLIANSFKFGKYVGPLK